MNNNVEPIIEIPDEAGEQIRNIEHNRLPEQNNSSQNFSNKKSHKKLFIIIECALVVIALALFFIFRSTNNDRNSINGSSNLINNVEEFDESLKSGKDITLNSDIVVAFNNTKLNTDINIDLNGFTLTLGDSIYANGKKLKIVDNKGTGSLDITNLFYTLNEKFDESKTIPVIESTISKDKLLYDPLLIGKNADGKIITIDFNNNIKVSYKYLNDEYELKKLNEDTLAYFMNNERTGSMTIDKPVEVILTDYTLKKNINFDIYGDGKLTIIGNITFEKGIITTNMETYEQLDLSGLTISGLTNEHSNNLFMVSGVDATNMVLPENCIFEDEYIKYNK